jgi:hypothetical protein
VVAGAPGLGTARRSREGDEEQEDLRWYLEDYLERADAVEPVTVR